MSIIVDALRTAMAPTKPRTSTGAPFSPDAGLVNQAKGFGAGILVGGLLATALLIRRDQPSLLR